MFNIISFLSRKKKKEDSALPVITKSDIKQAWEKWATSDDKGCFYDYVVDKHKEWLVFTEAGMSGGQLLKALHEAAKKQEEAHRLKTMYLA